MNKRRYKYVREDFGELSVKLNHLTIYLNFAGGFVEAINCLELTALREMTELQLDANSLDIISVQWCSTPPAKGNDIGYKYDRENNKLTVHLPHSVKKGDTFSFKTITRCYPTDHILEGVYRDSTPPGAPQQYMSQCQQWGFQRIMPIIDDCRAKCTMTTTIEADVAYTHLISNGNISRLSNPNGKASPKPGDPSRQVITYENPVPMAPYLFLVCVGTWDVLADQVVYPSGHRVRLEYLVPPGTVDSVRIPMAILKVAVLWIQKTQGYEYAGEIYRTICMNKSNFGGMENVGNTTIVTETALITEHTLDMAVMFAHAVTVHEFEHNQCGSETTMETPFDVWLNEAYTVDVERQFMADMFDTTFTRLHQVSIIRNPLVGPLAIEDAGYAGKIVREGFNNPFELIDSVTYVKAAEVIRMLRLILGVEQFRAGKTLYLSRYNNGNANTDQFFECFEEVSGRSLAQFKKEWLYRIGYPKVSATTRYDPAEETYRICLRQEIAEGQNPFHLPIAIALVDLTGRDIDGTARIVEFTEAQQEISFHGLSQPPAFASINRDYSFYGTFRRENEDTQMLVLQTRLDPNVYNRVDAFRQLTDRERIRLLKDPNYQISLQWLDVAGELLSDKKISSSLKAFFLGIDEQPLDRQYFTWYQELVIAREKLMLAINRRYRAELIAQFRRLDTYSVAPASPKSGIEDRILKQVLLDLIAIDDCTDSHTIILDHFYAATTATDRVIALLALNRSSSPLRIRVLEEVYEQWHSDLTAYANYLRVIASGTRDDVFTMIEAESRRPGFDVTQPAWSHALFFPVTGNSKIIWTDQGINWLTATIIALAPINEPTAWRLLNTFQHVAEMKPALQEKVRTAIETLLRHISEDTCPSVHGQARAFLQ